MAKPKQKRFPENQTPLQALIAARAIIEQPENWVQGGWGDDGKHWMMGALSRSTSTDIAVWDAALGFLRDAIADDRKSDQSLYNWNDTHSHAEVLAAYDRAIANATAATGGAV